MNNLNNLNSIRLTFYSKTYIKQKNERFLKTQQWQEMMLQIFLQEVSIYNTDVNIMKHLKTILEVFRLTWKKLISSPKYYALPLIAVVVFIKKLLLQTPQPQPIIGTSLSDFLNKLSAGSILQVLVKQNKLYFKDKANTIYKASHNLFPKTELFNRLMYFFSHSRKGNVYFQDLSSSFGVGTFFFVMVATALIFLLIFLKVQFNINKDSKKPQSSTFKDIIGLQDCKTALKEVIEFMRSPQSFKEVGARMRKGIIFYGPSGTGKTSLAKACAGEAGVPFFSCNAAEFRELYVGMGAKKVRELFKKARNSTPSIIYIDEIDAMGNRSSSKFDLEDGAGSEKNTTINQLLSEMDGFNSNQMILVIGSTNKMDLLDHALLRPGRFDLKLKVPLPTQKDRMEIFTHYLQNKKHKLSEKFIQEVSNRLRGWSGADLQNLANEAVYATLRRRSQFIEQEDIEKTLKVLF